MSQNRASARLETGDDSVSKRNNTTVDQRTIEEIEHTPRDRRRQRKQTRQCHGGSENDRGDPRKTRKTDEGGKMGDGNTKLR